MPRRASRPLLLLLQLLRLLQAPSALRRRALELPHGYDPVPEGRPLHQRRLLVGVVEAHGLEDGEPRRGG